MRGYCPVLESKLGRYSSGRVVPRACCTWTIGEESEWERSVMATEGRVSVNVIEREKRRRERQ